MKKKKKMLTHRKKNLLSTVLFIFKNMIAAISKEIYFLDLVFIFSVFSSISNCHPRGPNEIQKRNPPIDVIFFSVLICYLSFEKL